jgi:hypothetical protein
MNEWISVNIKPPTYTDILLTDGKNCWVGQALDNLNVFLASHPDYKKFEENEYGAPYITYSKPTHWVKLPNLTE